VARTRLAFTNNYDNDVLALPQVSVPSRKKPGTAEPNARPDLIRVGQGFCDPIPMLWQQIGMSLGNVTLTLLRQVNLTRQIGARKPAHHDSPFHLRSLTRGFKRRGIAGAKHERTLFPAACRPLLGRVAMAI
jgi:hypothetical protein